MLEKGQGTHVAPLNLPRLASFRTWDEHRELVAWGLPEANIQIQA